MSRPIEHWASGGGISSTWTSSEDINQHTRSKTLHGGLSKRVDIVQPDSSDQLSALNLSSRNPSDTSKMEWF